MVNVTKKPITNTDRRRLEDFPEWAEAQETLRRLRVEEEKIVAEIRAGAGPIQTTPQQIRVANLADSFAAKAAGTPEPTKASEGDQAGLAERLAAIKSAIEQHIRKIETLRNSLSSKVYAGWADEHLAARKRIAAAAVELKKAWDAERELAHKIHAVGGLESPLYGNRLLCNFANCSKLPGVLQSFQLGAFRQANANLLND